MRRHVGRPSAREFAWLSLSSQLTGVLSMLTLLVLARTGSVERFGQVVFAQTLAGVVMLVLDVRFEDALQRYYPIVSRDAGESDARAFFWRMLRLDAGFGLLVAVLASTTWAAGLLPDSGVADADLLVLALLGAAGASAAGTINAGFALTGQLRRLGKASAVVSVLTSAVIVAATLLAGGAGFLVGSAAAAVVHVLVLGFMVSRLLPPARGGGHAPPGFGRFLAQASLATSFSLGADNGLLTVAGAAGGPTVVAFLKVAQAPGRLLLAAFSAVAVQAFPRISGLAATGDGAGVRLLATRLTTALLCTGLAVAVPAAAALPYVVAALYGEAYEPAVPAAALLLVAAVARVAVTWSKVLPAAVGRPGARLAVVTAEGAVSLLTTAVIASTVAAPETAAAGIAAVGLAVSVAATVFWLHFVRREELLARERGVQTP